MTKFAVLFAILVSGVSFGQLTVKGNFVDKNSKPLNNVIVQLLQVGDSIQIKSGLSDVKGNFELTDIPKGDFILKYITVGSNAEFIDFDSDGPFADLGEITISIPESAPLQDVVDLTKKPLFQPYVDKIVVNVQENLTFAGGTALEVLSRSPGVSISREKNTIALNGKRNVMVMFDGNISKMPVAALLQKLEGMPAQNIQEIELIANPGAKMDVGNSDGIINIISISSKKP